MEDYTMNVLAGELKLPVIPADCMAEHLDTEVTMEVLRRNPRILETLRESFTEEIPEELTQEQKDECLLKILNLDPFTKGTLLECLHGMSDCIDDEGEPMYRPSAFDTDDASEILEHMNVIGLREDYEEVPAKWEHLSPKHKKMLWDNMTARRVIARMSAEHISDKIVEALCKKKTVP